jgi:thiol-disulfide isomerase/thioredoxin
MNVRWLVGISILLTLLTSARPLRGSEPLKFTVVGIDCKDCEPPILKALKAVPGVRNPRLDWKTGEASVDVEDGFDRERVRRAVQDLGFDAVFAGETRKDLEPLPEDVRRTLDIAAASDGKEVDLTRVLVPGKVTLVDYWASWCGPCHVLDIRLQHLVQSRPGLAVRRVNVGQFDNAAGKQATREFRMRAIPYVRVYDANGKFVGDNTAGRWDEVLALIAKADAASARPN